MLASCEQDLELCTSLYTQFNSHSKLMSREQVLALSPCINEPWFPETVCMVTLPSQICKKKTNRYNHFHEIKGSVTYGGNVTPILFLS